MPIEAIVDSIEKVPEELKKHYVEGADDLAGKFVLDVVKGGTLELVNWGRSKSALEASRKDAREAQKKVKELEERLSKLGDVDPEEARAALERIKDFDEKSHDSKIKERIDAGVKQYLKKHEDEKKTLQDDLKVALEELEGVLVDQAATKAIAEAKGYVDLLLPHVKRHVKMRKTDNKRYIAEVIDEHGNPQIADANGTPMNIPQFVESLRKRFPSAFEGIGASGSGAAGAGDRGAGARPGSKTVKASDPTAIADNFDKILTGEVTVDMNR